MAFKNYHYCMSHSMTLKSSPKSLQVKPSLESLTSFIANLNLGVSSSGTSPAARSREPVQCTCPGAPCRCFSVQGRVVADLERDLSMAAEVGQALLNDRLELQDQIEALNHQLESVNTENHELLGDNDELINQLSSLHDELVNADTCIADLSNDLNVAKGRISKLNTQNLRTLALEQQLQALEFVRESLMQELQLVNRDRREAEVRWRKSERLFEKLSSQYEQLEQETYSENTISKEMEQISQSTKTTIQDYVKSLLHENAKLEASVNELEEQLASYRHMIKSHKSDVMISEDQGQTDQNLNPLLSPALSPSVDYPISPPSSGRQSHHQRLVVKKRPSRLILHKQPEWDNMDSPESPLSRLSKSDQNQLGRELYSPPPGSPRESKVKVQPPLMQVEHNSPLIMPRLRRAASHESVLSMHPPEPPVVNLLNSHRPRIISSAVAGVSVTTASNVSVFAVPSTNTAAAQNLLSVMGANGAAPDLKGKRSAADSLRSAGETEDVRPNTQKSWAASFLTRFRGSATVAENTAEDTSKGDDNEVNVVSGIGFVV